MANSFTRTLFVGAAAAVTALLLAPKSGKELRKDLKIQANDLKDQAMDQVNSFTEEVKQSYKEVEEEISYTDPELAATIEDIAADLNIPSETIEDLEVTDTVEVPPISVVEDLSDAPDLSVEDRRGQL
ncbi:YtxH domain-containing protein [Carnobacterium sp. ISL-102]|uniref:YtxH domain-containing protein n=1 Tax=Carnobacterium sp. ISL-102 TaxID=2819142 RepID=UPI001BE7541D|nr:YtxH domain-containing protein [Carnobacterium sp. ISL-102]MBT2732997.1 YtxH domain-containing protein [Carnobacterium sp. ISL-102]